MSANFSQVLRKVRSSLANNSRAYGTGLNRLETALQTLKTDYNFSNTQLRKLIAQHGVCLKNMKDYGSPTQLRKFLKDHPDHIVQKKQAKQHDHVKMCLISVYGWRR